METVRVKHIGKHARRADTMSGEGTVWNGEGDIQTVSRKAWDNHLSKYPDLWVLAGDDEQPKGAAQPGLADKPVDGGEAKPDGETKTPPPDYEAMDRPALAKLATERGLIFDGRTSKARLVELLTA